MTLSKIIIDNHVGITDADALCMVLEIVRKGKISKTSRGDQYCHLTSWADKYFVFVRKNPSGSHRFVIYRQ